MPNQFFEALTNELQELNGKITTDTVADALSKAVTATLTGNSAKVILRRVVKPEGKVALTELELRDEYIQLYPDEVEALRAMLLI